MNWTEQTQKIRARVQSIQNSQAPIGTNAYSYNTRVVSVTSYVAQLLPIPDSLFQLERAMLHTVLRLPQNTFCHNDLIHMHRVGGPRLRSITAASSAAMIRSATKTTPGWRNWVQQLRTAAEKYLPLEPLVRDTLTPSFWDSPPIAHSLRDASLGFPSHPHFDISDSELICKIQHSSVGQMPVQKLVYRELISIKHKNCIQDTIQRRLTSLFQPFTLDFRSSISLEDLLGSSRKNRVAEVMKVLKSWCNGWATSRRFHEDIQLPCLFGCQGHSDDLAHYLQCPHLFALWSFLTPGVSADPLERWALINPCSESFLQLACVHSGYHAVRRNFKGSGVDFHENKLCSASLRAAWTVFADTYSVEARELGVNALKFSVPSFLNFLANVDRDNCLNDCLRSGPFEPGVLAPAHQLPPNP